MYYNKNPNSDCGIYEKVLHFYFVFLGFCRTNGNGNRKIKMSSLSDSIKTLQCQVSALDWNFRHGIHDEDKMNETIRNAERIYALVTRLKYTYRQETNSETTNKTS
jgi:hypothetical protein